MSCASMFVRNLRLPKYDLEIGPREAEQLTVWNVVRHVHDGKRVPVSRDHLQL